MSISGLGGSGKLARSLGNFRTNVRLADHYNAETRNEHIMGVVWGIYRLVKC